MKGIFEIKANEAYTIKGINQEMFNYELIPGMTVKDYVFNIIARGWKTWNGDNCIHAEIKELSVGEFLLIMSLDNSDVKYFNPFIKIATSALDNEIPEGITNRINPAVLDEGGNEITPASIKTWREWVLQNYTITDVEGYSYFLSAAGTGCSLTSEELMIIYNSTDATLVDEIPIIEIVE